MSQFNLVKEEIFGSMQAKLYSYKEENNELSLYIKKKVQQPAQNFLAVLENGNGDFFDKKPLLKRFQELSTPKDHRIPAFDVKRSVVTEFMAEYLLEKEFQCIFFEQANKKINKSLVDTNRHSTGVDVVGIQEKNQDLKFIVAEVKASKVKGIPCSSADNLKQDIKKALAFSEERLMTEIVSMFQNLGSNADLFKKYIQFLLELISKKNTPNALFQRLIIFPFLIRSNPKILEHKTLQDFKNFSELDTKGTETIGVVWAINKDIDSFTKSFYSHD